MLYDKLREYSANGRIPFHMPGHKRSSNYTYLTGAELDITEIDGFDNLHDPCGILREGMDLLSQVYGSVRSFYLINGSTGGILAAVRCVSPQFGGELIMARNCHKAVYNAAELVGAHVHYICPDCEPELGFCLAVSPDDIENSLSEYPNSQAVIITSPTYDGIISDIAAISEICHRHGVPLIVDEAHGAHLGFLDESVKSAVSLGADIVIQSFHKTLPSLTQTAVAHICGSIIAPEKYAAELAVFETSSPSYLLMASLDGCTRLLADKQRSDGFFSRWREIISYFDSKLDKFRHVHIYMHPSHSQQSYDKSKFVVSADSFCGTELAEILRQHSIEPEMVSAGYVLLMSGSDTSYSNIDTLTFVLEYIEAESEKRCNGDFERHEATLPCGITAQNQTHRIHVPEQKMSTAEARQHKSKIMHINELLDNAVSADYVFAYPPGIPIIVPGEIIDEKTLAELKRILKYSLNPATLHGTFDGKISIITQGDA